MLVCYWNDYRWRDKHNFHPECNSLHAVKQMIWWKRWQPALASSDRSHHIFSIPLLYWLHINKGLSCWSWSMVMVMALQAAGICDCSAMVILLQSCPREKIVLVMKKNNSPAGFIMFRIKWVCFRCGKLKWVARNNVLRYFWSLKKFWWSGNWGSRVTENEYTIFAVHNSGVWVKRIVMIALVI